MAFLQLFILVTVMFISTFILGSLPLSLSTTLSPTRFHQLSIFSVGLLIGAALTIVIPEGIDTIYSSSEASSSDLRANHTDASQPIVSHDPQLRHHHTTIGLALMGGFMLMFLIDQFTRIPTFVKKNPVEGRASRRNSSTRLSKVICSSSTSTTTSSSQTTRLLSEEGCHEDGRLSGPSHPSPNAEHDDDEELEPEGLNEEGLDDSGDGSPEMRGNNRTKNVKLQSHSFSTVIGLLTHSVADGIALGASSTHATHQETGGRLSLALIIFLAIMVHKAPAAFGMVAVLLAEGLSTGAVRRILLAFSLAAPMGALTTWTGLALVDRLTGRPADLPEKAEDAFQWWIGVTLLFSAGTFLFVATHALQNTSSNPVDPCCPQIPANPSPSPSSHPDPELPSHHLHLPARSPPPSSSQVSVSPLLTCCLMASGMCFPWLLTLLVGSHHH